MPRPSRQDIIRPGGVYHVIVRGNNKQVVFRDQDDYRRYQAFFLEAKSRHGALLFHFVLMPNHVHLLMAAGEDGLSMLMQSVQNSYAKYFCRKYEFVGHVWQGRFKSFPIETDAYLFACGNYIELNPVRAGLCARPGDWRHTSYHSYAIGKNHPLVDLDPFYETLANTQAGRQERYRALITQTRAS